MKNTVIAAGATLFALTLGAVAQAAAPGQPQPWEAEIRVANPRPNVHVLSGPGGNVTLVVGADGAIQVDSMWTQAGPRLKAAVEQITPQPVRYLVVTHYHVDHSGGAPAFGGQGTTVAGSGPLNQRLATGGTNDGGIFSPPVPPEGRPTVLVGDQPVTIRVQGQEAVLHHLSGAHTDGDTFAYFPNANVLSTGDLYSKGRMPGVDMNNGGDLDGVLAAYDRMLGIINDQTLVVPGHGDLATRADLAGTRAALADARARLAPLVAQGRPVDEVVASKPLGPDVQDGFVRALYRTIQKNS